MTRCSTTKRDTFSSPIMLDRHPYMGMFEALLLPLWRKHRASYIHYSLEKGNSISSKMLLVDYRRKRRF